MLKNNKVKCLPIDKFYKLRFMIYYYKFDFEVNLIEYVTNQYSNEYEIIIL